MGTPNQPGQPWQPGQQPGYSAQPGYQQQPGYGPQPGYQQQTGYGPQPGYGPGFPSSPAPKKRGPWLWLVPVLVVVVAAAVVVPILLTKGGGSSNAQGAGGGAPASSLQSWQVTAQQMTAYQQGLGARVDGNDFIVFADSGITAFDRNTGKKQWSMTPPGGGNAFCAVSRNVVHDQVAVAFGANAETGVDCTTTALLDLKKHSFVWQKQVSQFASSLGASGDPSGQGLVLAGNYLYAGAKTVIVRMSLSDGSVQSLGPGFSSGQDPCYVDDIDADSSSVYVLGGCIGDSTYEALLELDVNSGSLRTSGAMQAGDVKLPAEGAGGDGILGAQFVSTAPLVLLMYGSASDSNTSLGNFVALDASLKPSWVSTQQNDTATAIDTEQDSPGINDAAHQYNRAFVAKDLLFSVTIFQDSSGVPAANKVVALDVKTGQQKWATQLPGSSACDPVGVDGNALLVAADQLWTGDMNNPNTVFAKLDVQTGKVLSTKSQRNPVVGARSGVTLSAFQDMADIAWAVADGRLYGFEQGKSLNAGAPVAFSLG